MTCPQASHAAPPGIHPAPSGIVLLSSLAGAVSGARPSSGALGKATEVSADECKQLQNSCWLGLLRDEAFPQAGGDTTL